MPYRSLCRALVLMLNVMSLTRAQAQEAGAPDEITKFYQEVMSALSTQPRPTFPIEAETLISFIVAPDGSIESANIAQTSGSSPLDVAALEIVLNAAPSSLYPLPGPAPSPRPCFSAPTPRANSCWRWGCLSRRRCLCRLARPPLTGLAPAPCLRERLAPSG